MRPNCLAILAATLMAVPLIAAEGPPSAIESVSVSGTGRVELAPDRASFSVGVQTVVVFELR